MAEVRFLPPAAKYLKKLKDKRLKELYKVAIDAICKDYTIGEPKTGDLAGLYGYDTTITRPIMNLLIRWNTKVRRLSSWLWPGRAKTFTMS